MPSDKDGNPQEASVGVIRKPLFRASNTVDIYEWNGQAYARSSEKAQKGISIKEARPTDNPDFAWVLTATGQAGYVHTSHVDVPQDKWGQVKYPSDGLATADPARYAGRDAKAVDGNRLVENVSGLQRPVNDFNQEWFIDQAVLMEASRKLERQGRDEPDEAVRQQLADTRKQLDLAMLQAFAKAAPVEQTYTAVALGVQASPLQHERGSGATYHRSNSADPIPLQQLREAVRQEIGLPSSKSFQIVSDPAFAEVLAREFPVYARQDAQQHAVPTRIDTRESFEHAVDALIRNMQDGHPPAGTFTLDVTDFYKAQACTPAEMKDKISAPFEKILLDKLTTVAPAMSEEQRQALAAPILNQVQLVAFTEAKGVNLLLVPTLFPAPMSAQDKEMLPPAERAVQTALSVTDREVFMTPGSHDDRKLMSAMVESGARLDPAGARSAILEFKSAEQVLAMSGIQTTQLSTSGLKTPTVAANLGELLKRPTFQQFAALSDDPNAPPYQQIHPKATADLLKGLAAVSTPEGGIDASFRDKGVGDVLQHSYYRMLNAMAGAVHNKDDPVKFMNNVELIHDQMQMILAVTRPHEQDVVLSKAIKDQLTKGPGEGEPGIVPAKYEPQVHHKASAMHCVASILSAAEATKQAHEQTRELNTLVLRDNYYEADGAVHNARTYRNDQLDGRVLKTADGADRPLSPEAFGSKSLPEGKLDVFVCDFHHNISLGRDDYQVENLSHQVEELFRNKLVADRFTVAIDCTVDFAKSKDVKDFLDKHQDRIDEGRLNVVLYRSAQKFDMLGMDNYYGGFAVSINDGKSFKEFDARMAHKHDQLQGLSHQGMAHLAKFGGDHADHYRQALMDNTKLLYDALPAKCKGVEENPDTPLVIAKSTDPNNVFLDIQLRGTNAAFADTAVTNHFKDWAQKSEHLALTSRPSFGFATSNLTQVDHKMRLNPGLESKESIQKYAAYFTQLNEVLEKVRGTEGVTPENYQVHAEKALKEWPGPKIDPPRRSLEPQAYDGHIQQVWADGQHVTVQKVHQSRNPLEVVKVPAGHGFEAGQPVRVSGEPGNRQVMGQAQAQAHAQANRQALVGAHRH